MVLARNTESFIKKVKSIWGNRFDYSKVNYQDSRTHVTIICRERDEFT